MLIIVGGIVAFIVLPFINNDTKSKDKPKNQSKDQSNYKDEIEVNDIKI